MGFKHQHVLLPALEQAIDAVVLIDETNRVNFFNAAAERLAIAQDLPTIRIANEDRKSAIARTHEISPIAFVCRFGDKYTVLFPVDGCVFARYRLRNCRTGRQQNR